MSPSICLSRLEILARLKRLGFVGGAKEKPVTLAPSSVNHKDSHAPLNPVWPVSRTRRPRHRARLKSTSSKAHYLLSKVLPDGLGRAACPLDARSRDADRRSAGHLQPDAPLVPVPKLRCRRRYSPKLSARA